MMDPHRVLAITLRVFRGFKHDKRALGMMIVAPLVAMSVFGIAFGGEVSNIDIIVINEDQGWDLYGDSMGPLKISEMLIENMDRDVVNIERMTSMDDALEKVRDGDSWAVIHFPTDYSRAIVSGNSTTITIQADQSNQQIFAAILTTIRDASEVVMEKYDMTLPVTVDYSQAVYGKDAEFSDFLIPGVIGFAIFLLTTLLTLLTFTTERVNRTLDRLLVTPATEMEIVLGYALAFGCTGTLQAVLLVSWGIIAFDILVEGSILLAILITALLAIASMALGILLSSATRTEAQAVQMIPFIVLPVFLLSGIFWPFEAIPAWIRPFSYGLPPTYAVDALRSIMIRGWGAAEILVPIVALMVFAVIFLGLAALSLRRKG